MIEDISSAIYDYHDATTASGEGPEIYQGASYLRTYTVQKPDGSPEDLTGYVVTCKFADSDGIVVFVATGTITDPLNGEFQIFIPSTSTSAVAPVITPGAGTICAPAYFEAAPGQEEYQDLDFDIWLDDTVNGPQNVVRGRARFFSSTNL